MSQNEIIPSWIASRVKAYPHRRSLVQQLYQQQYRELSYGNFLEQIQLMSSYLRKQSVGPGCRVLILAENSPEWGIAALATLNLGATLVPLAAQSTKQELENILEQANPIFCFFSIHAKAFKGISQAKLPPFFSWDSLSLSPLEDALAGQSKCDWNPNGINPTAPALLIYTSGTSGSPKAVPLTHENVIANVLDVCEEIPLYEDDVAVSVLPLSHMLEFTGGFLLAIYNRMTVVYTHSLKSDAIMAAMSKYSCTIMLAVPLLYELISKSIQQKINSAPQIIRAYFAWAKAFGRKHRSMRRILFWPIVRKFGNIRFFVSGGSRLPESVYAFFEQMGIVMLQGYGLTETAPVLALTTPATSNPSSVGKPLKQVTLGIFDDEGQRLPEGKEGEVWAKGKNVFKGYLENTFNKSAFYEGWFRTGDLGVINEKGLLTITGRKKDIIVTAAGKNVYPEDLENLLNKTTAFSECSVLGTKDATGKEQVTVVVRAQKTELQKEFPDKELEAAARIKVNQLLRDVSDYMKPKRIEVVDFEFPRTHTKKVKRHVLAKQIDDAKESKEEVKVNSPQTLNPTQSFIVESLSQITGNSALADSVKLSDSLTQDLGLDSLSLVELVSSIEQRFSCVLGPIDFAVVDTLDKLANLTKKTIAQGQSKKVRQSDPYFSAFNPRAAWNSVFWFIRKINLWKLKILLHSLFSLKVKGLENLKENESYIFTPNHCSHFDTLAIHAALPTAISKRLFSVAAKDYFFDANWKALFARLLINAIPFDRKYRVQESMALCKQILDLNASLLIFPEGTRSPNGQLQKFKGGVEALLNHKQRVKAVPVAIRGTFAVLPKGRAFPKFAAIEVEFGKPKSYFQSNVSAAEELEKSVKEMLTAQTQ